MSDRRILQSEIEHFLCHRTPRKGAHDIMASQAVSKKRKSVSESDSATKKVKTVEPAAPLKSALKKPKNVQTDAAAKEKKGSKVVVGKNDEKPSGTINKSKTPKASAKESTAISAVSTKPAKKATTPKKESKKVELLGDDTETAGADLSSDQTAALLAGFSDSEEEEDAADSADPDHDAIPVSKIPSAPTAGLIKKRIKMAIDAQSDPETTPGVIFIGRLPHGFYEHQLRAYLSQFGDILHLRLARNKRTGRSQHYAFVEFASAAVSDIVAKTMDKYLLFDHILQVRRVRREDVKENMFAGESRKKPAPRNKLERGHLRRGMVREGWETRVEKEAQKRKEKEAKLKDMGYEFEMPALKTVSEVTVKPQVTVGIVGEGTDGSMAVEATEAIAEQAKPQTVTETSITVEPNGITVEEKITSKKRAAKDVKKKAKKVKT
nr:putative rna-binding protein [Quercus suber]